MARLVDFPQMVRSVGWKEFGRRVWQQIGEDHIFTFASALAYSWLFAIFPFLIFLLSLVPYLPPGVKENANQEAREFIYNVMPGPAADTIWPNIEKALDSVLEQKRRWLIFLGLLTSIWAASGGMMATMGALDRCYDLPESRAFWKQRLIALAMTVVVAALVLSVMALLPIGTAVRKWMIARELIDPRSTLLVTFDVARWTLAVLFMTIIMAVIYHFGVGVKHRFHWLTPGALFCLAAWIVLGLTFRFYVEKFGNYNKTYGTVGGVAVMLLLFYLDAAVLMIGAEINSEIDFEVLKVPRGSRNLLPAEDREEAKFRTRIRRLKARLAARFASFRRGWSGSKSNAQ
jgi:membrane protein